jgi:colanic acid biosynthesis protein WcaH
MNAGKPGNGGGTEPGRLSDAEFIRAIDAVPLVSIDLIVRNPAGEVLLGHRNNAPAAGFWFTPGGRVRKRERLADAYTRLAQGELGLALTLPQARLLGAYEHMYPDNVFGVDGIDTHYVVLGYELVLATAAEARACSQHAELRWWKLDELMASDAVHDNVKAYFRIAAA